MRKLRVKVTPEDVKRIKKELGEKSTVLTTSGHGLSDVIGWVSYAKVIFFDERVFYCESIACSNCEYFLATEQGCLPGSHLVTVDEFIEELIREFPVKKETSTEFSEEKKQQLFKGLVKAIKDSHSDLCPSSFGMKDAEDCNKISCTECAEAACKQFFEYLGV